MPSTQNEHAEEQKSSTSFLRKVLIFVAVAATITLLVLFIGFAIDVLLLIFAGFLLGIILRSLRDTVSKYTRLPSAPSLGLVIVLSFAILGGIGYQLLPRFYQQAETMYSRAPQEWNDFKQEIWQYSWGKEIARENPQPKDLLNEENNRVEEGNDMTRGVMNLFTGTAGAVASTALMLIISVYVAAEPEVYTNGFLRLIPKHRRARAAEIMDEIAMTVQWWLVGQITSMVILGILTTVGLWLMGIPYSLVLGTFTALMTFIPNLGPILAGIPTLLVAYLEGPTMVLYVAIFYVLMQTIEGYFITPMIHREIIEVPPVLIIAFQFLLYYLVGFIGVFVAMPLVACLMVIVQRVYIEDILGDSMQKEVANEYVGNTIL